MGDTKEWAVRAFESPGHSISPVDFMVKADHYAIEGYNVLVFYTNGIRNDSFNEWVSVKEIKKGLL